MSLVQLDLFLRLIMSPLLIVTAILIMISSIKMWKKYHLDKTLCCTCLLYTSQMEIDYTEDLFSVRLVVFL